MARSALAGRVAPVLRLGAAIVVAFSSGGRVLAAGPSPSVSPSPSPPTCPDPFVAWYDQALAADIPAGQQVPIGFTVWDCNGGSLAFTTSAQVRVHPKVGKDTPVVFPTRSDWTGHLLTTIESPKGGLGEIEVGFPGQVCRDDGTCEAAFFPFAIGGVGPPPEASRAVLVEARIAPGGDRLVAGHPFPVDVVLEPRAGWAADALAMPDRIVVEAQVVRGDTRWVSDATRPAGSGGPYSAMLTVDEPGDIVLRAGIPGPGGEARLIETGSARVIVEPGDGTIETPPPAGATGAPGQGDALPPILPIAAGIVGIVVVSLVIRRAFADL
jgi:hypothetical protein